jgi:hypothetical protein
VRCGRNARRVEPCQLIAQDPGGTGARPDHDDGAPAGAELAELSVKRTAVHRSHHEDLLVPGGEVGVGLGARTAVHVAMTGHRDRGHDSRDRRAGGHAWTEPNARSQ